MSGNMQDKIDVVYASLPLHILYIFKTTGKSEMSFQEIIEIMRRNNIYIDEKREEILPAIIYLVENNFIEKSVSNNLIFRISPRGLQIANLFEKILARTFQRDAQAT